MFNLIEMYIKKMTKEDISNFAKSKEIDLSNEELDFTYNFVKRNYKDFLGNPKLLDLNRYKNNYSQENFNKIVKVYQEYTQKYANYL